MHDPSGPGVSDKQGHTIMCVGCLLLCRLARVRCVGSPSLSHSKSSWRLLDCTGLIYDNLSSYGGICFVHGRDQVMGHTPSTHAHVVSGKEEVYIDGPVSAKRTFTNRRVHAFTGRVGTASVHAASACRLLVSYKPV